MDVEVIIDTENQTASIKSPKYLSEFKVSKAPGGFIFFKIEFVGGAPIPNDLSGVYSSVNKAVEAIKTFLLTAKETQSAKNERLDKERKERKNAVSISEGR